MDAVPMFKSPNQYRPPVQLRLGPRNITQTIRPTVSQPNREPAHSRLSPQQPKKKFTAQSLLSPKLRPQQSFCLPTRSISLQALHLPQFQVLVQQPLYTRPPLQHQLPWDQWRVPPVVVRGQGDLNDLTSKQDGTRRPLDPTLRWVVNSQTCHPVLSPYPLRILFQLSKSWPQTVLKCRSPSWQPLTLIRPSWRRSPSVKL